MEPETYKIVRVSNYDYDDHRGDEWVAADNIPTHKLAQVMCDALIDAELNDDDYFKVVTSDYVLPPEWEP